MISYDMRKLVYEKAIEHFGTETQMVVAIEEMSELIKEICKSFRGQLDMDGLVEEIADATIMLEQLRLVFDVNDLVVEEMDRKINRLGVYRLGMTDKRLEL